MSKVRMKKIFICGLDSERDAVLDTLERAGAVEITALDPEETGLGVISSADQKNSALSKVTTAEQALSALSEFAPEKKGLLSMFEGVKEMDLPTFAEKSEEVDATMDKALEINALYKEIAGEKAAVPKCQTRLEALSAWQDVDVPLDFSGTRKTRAFIGSLNQDLDTAGILSLIDANVPDGAEIDTDVTVFYRSKMMTSFMALSHEDDAEKLETALRRINFIKAPAGSMIPRDEAEQIKKEIAAHEAKRLELIEKLKTYAVYRDGIKLASDYYTLLADKYSAEEEISRSENAFFISGYTPEPAAASLEEKLGKFTAEVEISDPAEDEDTPVALKNGLLSAPMETIVESYSLPSKAEIDPSRVTAVFYYILFGLMLSDAGYGLLLVLGCGFILLKVKNLKPSMEKMVKLLFFSGIATTFWGFMFGSFFGDAVNVIATTFFNRPDIAFRPLWFDAMKEPIRLLAFAFLVGIIHLFTGMFVKLYQLLKERRYMDAFCDVVLWLMFVGGAIVFMLSLDMISDMLSLSFTVPPAVASAAGYTAVIGFIGVVLFDGRAQKNPLLRLLLGLYGAYGISSWLSDILSYSRLLALGLATGCIAQVFNKLGTMMGSSFFGVIFFIVIFVIGNVLNLAINVLGAYVHANRLQFVEFFGKFYEGGGRQFEPLRQNTRYYQVKEDI